MDNDYLHGDIPEAHGQKASISLDMNQSAGGSWAANTSTPENLSFDTSNTHEYIFERFNEGQTDQISHLKKKIVTLSFISACISKPSASHQCTLVI